jgi:hypothetical protein
MDAIAVVLLLVLVLGWAAFLFTALFVVGRVITGVGRGMVSIFQPRRRGGSGRRLSPGRRGRVCSHPQCRKIEYRDALSCSQCGTRLTEARIKNRPEHA